MIKGNNILQGIYSMGLDISTQSITVIVTRIDAITETPKALQNCNQKECAPQLTMLGEWQERFVTDDTIKKYHLNTDTCTIQGLEKGDASQAPGMYLHTLERVLSKIDTSICNKIDIINISSQQHSHVYLNKKFPKYLSRLSKNTASLEKYFEACYAYPYAPNWMTCNTQKQVDEILSNITIDTTLQYSIPYAPLRFTAPIIRRIATSHPKAYQHTYRIHLINSFLAAIFSGNTHTPIDYGNACSTMLLQYNNKTWSNMLLHATTKDIIKCETSLQYKLPSIAHPLHIAGRIHPYFQNTFGFSPHCNICIGSGDTPQSKTLVDGDMLSLGTSFVMMKNFSPSDDEIEYTAHTPHYTQHLHAMYDGLGRGFIFAGRTNGALVWDRIRRACGYDLEMANVQLATDVFENDLIICQPLSESFPSPQLLEEFPSIRSILNKHTYPIQEIERRIYMSRDTHQKAQVYSSVVNGSLAVMSYFTKQVMGNSDDTLYITGGAATSHAILYRISAFWQRPVVSLGKVGAALGAALAGYKAIQQNIDIQAMIAHTSNSALRVTAKKEDMAKATQYFA